MATKSRNAIIVVIGVSLFLIFKGYSSGHFSSEPSVLKVEKNKQYYQNNFSKNADPKNNEDLRSPSSFLHQESDAFIEKGRGPKTSAQEERIGHNHEECLKNLRRAQENMERGKLSAKELAELEKQMEVEHKKWQEQAKSEFEEDAFSEKEQKRTRAELQKEFLEEVQRIEESNESIDFDDMEI